MYVNKLLEARGYNTSHMVKLSHNNYVIPNTLHVVDSSNVRVTATVINEIKEKITEDIIIVLYLQATHEALKKSDSPVRSDVDRSNKPVLELFNMRYLMFDFISYLPPYVRYTPVKKYKKQMPQIRANDPSVKYYGFKAGDYISVDDSWHEMLYFVV